MELNRPKRWIPRTGVAARYGRSGQCIDRWASDPRLGFPQPIKIGRQQFYDEAELDAFDERQRIKHNAA